jgi:hypothetical protein
MYFTSDNDMIFILLYSLYIYDYDVIRNSYVENYPNMQVIMLAGIFLIINRGRKRWPFMGSYGRLFEAIEGYIADFLTKISTIPLECIYVYHVRFTISIQQLHNNPLYEGGFHTLRPTIMCRGGASPPKLGGKLKKKFWGAKIRKNNKIWDKILIFNFFLNFFGENLGAWGGLPPPKPQGGSTPDHVRGCCAVIVMV